MTAKEVRVTSETGGQKGTKLARYDLIPSEALRTVAELYGKGAEKYDDHNWAKGYDWSLSFAALQRHAWQFWAGENNDEETGLPHMASVAFHALALITFMTEHPEYDNRPGTG
ncbi:dATP/dGTP diphosphohydrolase domain-containing protein [Nakamurella lactea]|uniref:dATP/dGTP diphosphohydrolase domain-containing protein n=1 Tax=Nakamurella lactea TaxID=459515 RepID=UPI0004071C10|nr:dATP/dGTP diphosphohydrolase domain-containing protein [Nakamurella lactea]